MHALVIIVKQRMANAFGRLPARKVVARIGRLLLNTALLYILAYRKAIISLLLV